jgi:MFS family permease
MNGFRIWCILFCSFGAFFYGYDSGLTTSIIAYPEFIEYFDFDSTTLGLLNSVYYAGNFVGASLNAWLPDKFGRLRVVQLACVISLLGCGMQTGAQGLTVLLVGRAIGGLACGLVWSCCPMYASEVSPPHLRGFVGGLYK